MGRCRLLATAMVVLAAAVLLPLQAARAATGVAVDLGSAAPFAVLGGSAVSNTGDTMVNGDLGVSPGTAASITSGMVTGTIHAGDDVAARAQADMATAYKSALDQSPDAPLAGDLGGMTLSPGLYSFDAAATLGGTLTLDGGGDPNAVFVFQIGSTITTAANSAVVLTGGAQACHVTWLIGSSATLGAATSFRGDVLADVAITAGAGSTVEGRLLAKSGEVTLDTNTVTATTCATVGPLSVTLPPAGDFASRGVTGIAQTTTATLDAFSVSDPRGTGAGWHVTAEATGFTGPSRRLSTSSLSMSTPAVEASGTTSPLPTMASGPFVIDSGTAVSFASAGIDQGMGTYLFGATTLTLALPADVYADVYASTITISVLSGP